ncbi:DUF2232 domain-containing protein [Magnetococcus sp. PR-3]|uniref:DUF2232 domain-containing protein n=1 Tax=Magnetococcus sp. PR-3 TaxID=3120355 RepID=UPI002FCE2FFC
MERILYHPAVSGLLSALMVTAITTGSHLAPLAIVLISLPLYMTGFRNGSRAALLALLVPVLALGFQAKDPLAALFLIGPYLVLPWLVVKMIRDMGYGIQQAMGMGFLFGCFAVVLATASAPSSDTDSLMNRYLETQKTAILKEAGKQQKGVQAFTAEQKVQLEETIDQIVLTVRYLFASLLALTWFLIQAINLHLSRVMLTAQGAWHGESEERLRSMRLPLRWVWAILLLVGVSYVGSGTVQQLAVNLLLFALIPYLFQGWAILDSWFRYKQIKRHIRLLFWAMVVVFWLQQFMLMLVLLGLFDTWFDFRKKMAGTQNREG